MRCLTNLGARRVGIGLRPSWLPSDSSGLFGLSLLVLTLSRCWFSVGLLGKSPADREQGQADCKARRKEMSGMHVRLPLAGEMIGHRFALCERLKIETLFPLNPKQR